MMVPQVTGRGQFIAEDLWLKYDTLTLPTKKCLVLINYIKLRLDNALFYYFYCGNHFLSQYAFLIYQFGVKI